MIHRLRRFALYLAAWTVVALLSASQGSLAYRATGSGPVLLGLAIKLSLASWYVWAALAPIAIWAARRFPLEAGSWIRRLPIHLVLNAFLAITAVTAYLFVRAMLGVASPRSFLVELAESANVHLVTYWAVIGVVHGLDYYRRAREREMRAVELAAQLAAARLEALRMQLHPHFLFNTMHAIASLVREDPGAAEDMLAELAELLRTILEHPPGHEAPLHEELGFIERYIAIQQIRFGDRLDVRRAIDPDTLDAFVPALILQPLVENAIEHGVARRRAGGTIELTAERRNETVVLRVADDGPGLDSAEPGHGVGLENARGRLAQLYGPAGRLTLRRRAAGGAEVTMSIPYHSKPAAPEAGGGSRTAEVLQTAAASSSP
ncbi:MAG: sensor histidine kinase [Longimicrobiales bacterium]